MNIAVRVVRSLYFVHCDPLHLGGTSSQRDRFNTAVFISPKRDLLFVKNEKCGSNTARMRLQHLAASAPLPEGFRDTNRWAAPLLMPSDLKLRRVEDLNDLIAFKFAIIRNPYVRLLSCYLSKFGGKPGSEGKFDNKFAEGRPGSFDEFVARVEAQTPEQMDPHWRTQYYNIYCNYLRYDQLVKFENYETEFNAITQRFFGKSEERNVRKGEHNGAKRLAQYYTPEIAARVRAKFAIDFETFGYSKDIADAA